MIIRDGQSLIAKRRHWTWTKSGYELVQMKKGWAPGLPNREAAVTTLPFEIDVELLPLRRTDANHKPLTDRIERPILGQGGQLGKDRF